MFLEELAADDFSHGGHFLFLEFLRGDAGVKVMKQLTAKRRQYAGELIMSHIIIEEELQVCFLKNEHKKYSEIFEF